MLKSVEAETCAHAMFTLGKLILADGETVSPRGAATRELLCTTVQIRNPHHALPLNINRVKLQPALGALEAVQLIGGFSDVDLSLRVQPNLQQFTNDGAFHGAYGPRVYPQLPLLIRKLQNDAFTRQAVITIWNPALDNISLRNDYPCTVSLIFAIRNNQLLLFTHMRSNDLWWGFSYDAFQFTQLQCTIANVLGVEPGPYTHTAVSMHVYERDIGKVEALHEPSGEVTIEAAGIGKPNTPLLAVLSRAVRIGRGIALTDETVSEAWYRKQLAPYV